MQGDFNQWLFENASRQQYVNLLQQQGRAFSAADQVTQSLLQSSRLEQALADVIGPSGVAKGSPGFEVFLNDDKSLMLGAGDLYVDGLSVRNHYPFSLVDQTGRAQFIPGEDALEDGEAALVYLDVWRSTVSADEDPLLLDPSLEGRDTSVADKVRWMVGLMPIEGTAYTKEAFEMTARLGTLIEFDDLMSTGAMRAFTKAPDLDLDEDDCLIEPGASYRAASDYLYRIEIVESGRTRDGASPKFAWSRMNGSVVSSLSQDSDGAVFLEPRAMQHEFGFSPGDLIEVTNALDRQLGRPGRFGTVQDSDGRISTSLLHDPSEPGSGSFQADADYLVRRWDQNTDTPLEVGTAETELEHGVAVQFIDGQYQVGDFWCVRASAATGTIIWPPFRAANSNGFMPSFGWGRKRVPLAIVKPKDEGFEAVQDVRPIFPSLTNIDADDIPFDNSVCKIEADTVQGALEELCRRETDSGDPHCDFSTNNVSELEKFVASLRPAPEPGGIVMPPASIPIFNRRVTLPSEIPPIVFPNSPPEPGPREPIPPRTDPGLRSATDIVREFRRDLASRRTNVDPATSIVRRMGIEDVRRIIDEFENRSADVSIDADVEKPETLARTRSVTICLGRGLYDLKTPLGFSDFDSVTIRGSGRDTILKAPDKSGTALVFKKCKSIRLENLSVVSNATKLKLKKADMPQGVVHAQVSDEAVFSNLHLETGDVQLRHSAALSVDADGTADIRVTECKIVPGMGQIGLNVISPRRCVIENNRIGPAFQDKQAVVGVVAEVDKGYIRHHAENIVYTVTEPRRSALRLSRADREPEEPMVTSDDFTDRKFRRDINLDGNTFNVPIVFEEAFKSFAKLAKNELTEKTEKEKYDFLIEKMTDSLSNEDGVTMVGGKIFNGFQEIRAKYLDDVSVHATEGIFISGKKIGEVIISHSEIFKCSTCIRILDTRDTDRDLRDLRSRILGLFEMTVDTKFEVNHARRVYITGNRLMQHVRDAQVETKGILVGHALTCIISENDIETDYDHGDTESYGIAVIGSLTRHLSINRNSVFKNRDAIFAHPQVANDGRAEVSYNAYDGSMSIGSRITVQHF